MLCECRADVASQLHKYKIEHFLFISIIRTVYFAAGMLIGCINWLIFAITVSKLGPCESLMVHCQVKNRPREDFHLAVERTFDDHLIITVTNDTADYHHGRSIDVRIGGKYKFSDDVRIEYNSNFVDWDQLSSLLKCFDVKPAGQSFGCKTCNAVCLKLEANKPKEFRNDAIDLTIDVQLLYCQKSGSLGLCQPKTDPQSCGHLVSKSLKPGDSHYSRINRSYYTQSPLQRIISKFEKGVTSYEDASLLKEKQYKNHPYHFYIEHTIDNRLFGLIGYANRSLHLAGMFHLSKKEFKTAKIDVKCSNGKSIGKEFDFVCPTVHPIEVTSCGAVKFKMTFKAIGCNPAYRRDGWLCYKNRLIEAVQPNMELNEEIDIGFRVGTDGSSVVSTSRPLHPEYILYNKMLQGDPNWQYKCSIEGQYKNFVIGFQRISKYFIFTLWLKKYCDREIWVLLSHKKLETQTMFKKRTKRICLDAMPIGQNPACEKCNRVCSFFYDMNGGKSVNDPISFRYIMEQISCRESGEAGPPLIKKTCENANTNKITMKIGDEIMLN